MRARASSPIFRKMTTPTLDLWCDYVDPASYLVDRLLREVNAELELDLRVHPFEIRRPPTPIVDATDPGWSEYQRRMEEEARLAGVEMTAPRFVPWSRKAHEAALFAREAGRFEAVHRALFRAHFVDGLDIGRVDVLVRLGGGAGLDPGALKAALDVDHHVEELEAERTRGVERGIKGVPTLLAGTEKLEGFHRSDGIRTFLQRASRATQR